MVMPWAPGQVNIRGQKWFPLDDVVVEPGVGGGIKVWNGSSWDKRPIKVWTGSAWVRRPLKQWDGTTWRRVG